MSASYYGNLNIYNLYCGTWTAFLFDSLVITKCAFVLLAVVKARSRWGYRLKVFIWTSSRSEKRNTKIEQKGLAKCAEYRVICGSSTSFYIEQISRSLKKTCIYI